MPHQRKYCFFVPTSNTPPNCIETTSKQRQTENFQHQINPNNILPTFFTKNGMHPSPSNFCNINNSTLNFIPFDTSDD
jgi:hypothetical protein